MAKGPKDGIPRTASAAAGILKQKLGRTPIPQPELVAAEFIECAGGPRAFGKMLWTEYNSSSVGTMARVRILDMVRSFIKEAQGREIRSGELDELDTVELESLMRELASKAGVPLDAAAPAGPARPAAEEEAEHPAPQPAPQGEGAGEPRAGGDAQAAGDSPA